MGPKYTITIVFKPLIEYLNKIEEAQSGYLPKQQKARGVEPGNLGAG